MRNFFDEQGRTRVLARGVLRVRRGLKPAENAAQRKKSHLGAQLMFETALAGIHHSHIRLIAGFDGLIVVSGAAGLNDR